MKPKHLLWTGEWIDVEHFPLNQNRSFLYGDGFFETMRWDNFKECRLWDFHWNRISKTILALHFPWPAHLDKAHFFEMIAKQIPENEESDIRVKIIFFRTGTGRYAPEESKLGLWFEIEDLHQPWIQQISRIGKAKTLHLSKSTFSWIKSTSALPYVLAGIEKSHRDLDDLVLCNGNGLVVEGSFACIFWSKNGQLYLPDEKLGGLDSCMRRFLIQHWHENKIEVLHVSASWEEIENAEWIGFGSGTGIRFWLNNMQELPYHVLPQFSL